MKKGKWYSYTQLTVHLKLSPASYKHYWMRGPCCVPYTGLGRLREEEEDTALKPKLL